jgi:hypothetical protein
LQQPTMSVEVEPHRCHWEQRQHEEHKLMLLTAGDALQPAKSSTRCCQTSSTWATYCLQYMPGWGSWEARSLQLKRGSRNCMQLQLAAC